MKTKLTPEIIYQEWHRETFKVAHGFYPKAIKNFTKAQGLEEWKYFEKFVEICERTGMIDYKKYISVLAEFFKYRFPPVELLKPHSMKMYTNKLKNEELLESRDQSIKRSYEFILKYIEENEMTLKEYFNENLEMVPTFIKHYKQRNISKLFLESIKYVRDICESLPADIKIMLND